MAAGPRRPRLSRRVRRVLLLGAARPDPRAGRRPGSRAARSSCSIAASVSPLISAATAAAGTAPIPITCPAPTAAMRTGRRTASGAGPRSVGPDTEGLVIAILAHRPHPEQGFRTCLGILRLFRDLDPAPRRSRLGPGPADRCADLQEHRFHPRQPPRPRTRHAESARRHRPRQPARPAATSIEEIHHARPSDPRSPAPTLACTAWSRASRISKPTRRRAPSSMPNGSPCCSTAR